jgi:hypothetical protein
LSFASRKRNEETETTVDAAIIISGCRFCNLLRQISKYEEAFFHSPRAMEMNENLTEMKKKWKKGKNEI